MGGQQGVELPSDGQAGKQQVGQLETRDDAGVSLVQTVNLLATATTITITTSRKYLLAATSKYNIEVRLDGTAPPAASDTAHVPLPSSAIIITYFKAGSKLSVIKSSGESDGRLSLYPL